MAWPPKAQTRAVHLDSYIGFPALAMNEPMSPPLGQGKAGRRSIITFSSLDKVSGPHRGLDLEFAGADLEGAKGVLLLLHGRYGSSREILGFARYLDPRSWAFVAPTAGGREWFPGDIQAPLASNEPWLGSALEAIEAILEELRGNGAARLAVLGFSQGACLALETAARNPGAVEAVFGLSGALLGPPDQVRSDPPSRSSLKVYLGSHEEDPYIPAAAVRRTAEHFRELGADTRLVLHPGSSHSIRPQDIAAVQDFLAS
jgi:phospholipase/carboxylesterase